MADSTADPRSRGALSAMNVVDLKSLASRLGIRGTARMRKDDIVAAIAAHQSGGAPAGQQPSAAPSAGSSAASSAPRRAEAAVGAPAPRDEAEQRDERALLEENRRRAAAQAELARAEQARTESRTEPRTESREQPSAEPAPREQPQRDQPQREQREREPQREQPQRDQPQREQREREPQREQPQREQPQREQPQREQREQRQQPAQGGQQAAQTREHRQQPTQGGSQRDQQRDQQRDHQAAQGGQGAQSAAAAADDDERGTGRRRNRQRNRDRKRRGTTTGQEYEPEVQVADDDVLVPVAGILDVLENYAFVRTTGYLPGPSDVYVPLGLVKKHALRKGDAVTGAVKALREGEQPQSGGSTGRQKFNALVRLDSVNGQNLDEARTRADFARLTPLYPQERLRLETEASTWTTRVIDLVAPVGKGSRLLVVAPPTTGRSSLLQTLATAVTTNNPECHVMVVLVDERPEEVTEMQRSVKGEVIASTFDRTAEDHTTIAELAVERAKRLVELGHDVVLLLDSLTALARAYNVAGATTGRILAGGLDAGALHPPKALFGAARKIENGGSLTVVATAVSDTASRLDEAVLEELRGTANAELHLARDLTDRRDVVPVDVNASGTRREEQLLGGEQLDAVWKLRRVLRTLEPEKALDLLLTRLRKSRTNAEFLRTVQSTSPSALGADA